MRLSSILLAACLAAVPALAADDCPVKYNYCEVWTGTCATGTTQSPIASNASGRQLDPSLPIPRFTYPATVLEAINTGTTIKVHVKTPQTLHLGTTDYYLDEFHFHTPAEHRIDIWMRPPNAVVAELHLVHKNATGAAVVIAVPIRLGESNKVLEALKNLGPINCDDKETAPLDLTALLPAIRGAYINYVGSLTTPKCDPGVRFVLMANGITATQAELNAIKVVCNARPVQYNTNRVTYRTSTRKR